MSPEVLARKLRYIDRYLDDLREHAGRDAEELIRDPYEVERLLELLVQVSADILSHLLAERKVTPESYRATFELAARHDLVPGDLGPRLAEAAGLRNILVHMYEEIDYEIVAESIGPALEDFGRLANHLRATLGR